MRTKARHIDTRYCGSHSQEGEVRPLQQCLEEFGDLAFFVVGQLGEVSQDLHEYLKRCAKSKCIKLSNFQGQPYQTLRSPKSCSSFEEDCQFVQSVPSRHAFLLDWATMAQGPKELLTGGMLPGISMSYPGETLRLTGK